MKTLNEYLSLPYRMEVIPDPEESGYVVSFPDLPGCLTTGTTVDQAVANALDAKKEWITAAMESGYPINEPDEVENYSGQFKLRIPKSLHKSLADHAREEGVSMNQYCVYLLSRNDVYNMTH
ncbi:MAG: type II toxin-antitoxin system HicB family antitoxin [Lachnospiraceae bacterium]|nr:type II toxin-antitoxin system HicB family antitoxin [Lachnospiraceae bacterium]